MKYIILIGIIYLVYRFYNNPKKKEERLEEFPPPPEVQEDLGDYTDYEELE